MTKIWESHSEAFCHFSQALELMEARIREMGGRVEGLEDLSLGPEARVEAKVKLSFTGSELREYISRLPPRVLDTSQG
jgi:hypothetical protein